MDRMTEVATRLPWWGQENLNRCFLEPGHNNLEDLPIDVFSHILTFLETKELIRRTSLVSKGWRYLWIEAPCLNLDSTSFENMAAFDRFVLWVLASHRSPYIKILIYRRRGIQRKSLQKALDRILDQVVLAGVEAVELDLQTNNGGSRKLTIPPFLLECKTLKNLLLKYCHPAEIAKTLIKAANEVKPLELFHMEHFTPWDVFMPPHYLFEMIGNPFGFRSITNLHMNSISLTYAKYQHLGPFDNCLNLETLHLSEITLISDIVPSNFFISARKLKYLKLTCNDFKCMVVVVAPHLTYFQHLFSSPKSTFEFVHHMNRGMRISVLEDGKSNNPPTMFHPHGFVRWTHNHGEDMRLSYRVLQTQCVRAAWEHLEHLEYTGLRLWKFAEGSEEIVSVNI